MTNAQPSAREASRDLGPEEVVHIVSDWEHYSSMFLRRVPRARCGESLEQDPDRAELSWDAPMCRPCERLEAEAQR